MELQRWLVSAWVGRSGCLLRLDIISDTRASDQAAMNRICEGRFLAAGTGAWVWAFWNGVLSSDEAKTTNKEWHVWLAKADAPAIEASDLHYHIIS